MITQCKLLGFNIEIDLKERKALTENENIHWETDLVKEWTHTVFKKIYETKKLPCPFAFKKGCKYKKGKGVIYFQVNCKEYGNNIKRVRLTVSERFDFDIVT